PGKPPESHEFRFGNIGRSPIRLKTVAEALRILERGLEA
ncbi:MAG: damage-inducible protein CinA, partial [Candidatus Omnitrophota bacterium]